MSKKTAAVKIKPAKNVREWFAFFGGEELDVPLDKASIIWDAAILSIKELPKPRCIWKYVSDDGYWHTSCGEDFVFNDGTPQENGVLFCHHCGGPALIQKVKEQPF